MAVADDMTPHEDVTVRRTELRLSLLGSHGLLFFPMS